MNILTNQTESWASKVNFVDRKNTVVGYDLSQSCCENAGWYISFQKRTDTDAMETIKDGLDGYVFDREFFENVDGADVDHGGMVRFRLFEEGKPDLFLHIFNSHNGYYSHGFTVSYSGTVVRDKSL